MRWNLIGVILILYFLSIGTQLYSSDSQVMYETARSLAFDGTIFLPSDFGLPQIRQDSVGRWVSQYDPGLPLLAAPWVWLTDQLAASQSWHRYGFSAYMLAAISALGASLAVASLYELSQTLYVDRRLALWLALAVGLCTPLWAYGRLFFAEGLLAGLLTCAVWGVYRGCKRGLLLGGFCLGLAILTRAAMAIYLLPLLALVLSSKADATQAAVGTQYIASTGNKRTKMRRFPVFNTSIFHPSLILNLALFLIFPILGIIGLLIHNTIRFDDPLQFGYGDQGFTTPIYEGAAGLLFSPGKSVFLYAPPLILSVLYFPSFYRREPRLAQTLLLMALIAVPFYSLWWAWHGGWSWGPRFLLPLIPLWILPAGEAFSSTTGRRSFMAMALLGFLIGFLGVFTNVNDYYAAQDMVHYGTGSPILAAAKNALQGRLESPGILHLQEFGWLPFPALAFPLILLCGGLLCWVRIVKELR
jgi:hypothetical protein